jgi:hypothetical protein
MQAFPDYMSARTLGAAQSLLSDDKMNRGPWKLSNTVEEKLDIQGPEPSATYDIVHDIRELVADVKGLTAEAGSLAEQANLHCTTGEQSPRRILYREIHINSDTLHASFQAPPRQENPYVTPSTITYDNHFSPGVPSTMASWYTSEEVAVNSLCLETFFSQRRILLVGPPFKPATINRKTMLRLAEWSQTSTPSQTLWIRSRNTPCRGLENNCTRIGVKIIELARRANVPIISYFCQEDCINSSVSQSAGTSGSIELTSMLYALIRQTIQILPKESKIDLDMSDARFQRLDGSKAVWDDALTLLGVLLLSVRLTAFCVLEGIQWLEHGNSAKKVEALLKTLRRSSLNVLLITSGACASPRDLISKDETLGDEDLNTGMFKEDIEKHSNKLWA